jgi:hypothetical protein
MMYETQKEMDNVIGKLDDNSFINQQKEGLKEFRRQADEIRKAFKL